MQSGTIGSTVDAVHEEIKLGPIALNLDVKVKIEEINMKERKGIDGTCKKMVIKDINKRYYFEIHEFYFYVSNRNHV